MEVNTIYNENNIMTLSRIPDNFLDMVITSPPYDDMDEKFVPLPKKGLRSYKGYTWNFKGIVKELYRTLKEGGVVVWNVNDPTIDGSESLASCYQKIYFRKVGFRIHDTMIYRKKSYLPKNHRRYEQTFEYVFVFSKGNPKTFNPILENTKYAGKINSGNKREKGPGEDKLVALWGAGKPYKDTKIKGNIWTYPTGWMHSYKEEYLKGHSAIFPEQLATDHILSWSNEGDIVYDPFMGSGTVAKVCKLLNRKYIGSEISEEYCKISERRVRETIVPLF